MSIVTAASNADWYTHPAMAGEIDTGNAADVFCFNLEQLLEEKGFKQAAFARRIGVSRALVGHWISGASFPRPHHLDLIAAGLGVPVSRLFVDPDDEKEALDPAPTDPELDIEAAIALLSKAKARMSPPDKS